MIDNIDIIFIIWDKHKIYPRFKPGKISATAAKKFCRRNFLSYLQVNPSLRWTEFADFCKILRLKYADTAYSQTYSEYKTPKNEHSAIAGNKRAGARMSAGTGWGGSGE